MSDQIKFNSELEVTQTATFGGTVDVSGTATFNNQVAIVATNDTVSIVATGVSITASTTITGAVRINGATDISGTVTLTNGTLAVFGDTTITGSLTCTDLQLSGSDKLTEILTKEEQINFGSISGNAVGTYSCLLTGVVLGSFNVVIVDTPDILNDAFLVDGVVTANDTVSLKLHNTSNGTQTAITATFKVAVLQFT